MTSIFFLGSDKEEGSRRSSKKSTKSTSKSSPRSSSRKSHRPGHLSDAEIKSLKRSSSDRLSDASRKSSGSPTPKRRASPPLKLTLASSPKHRSRSPSVGSDSSFKMSSPTKNAPETSAPAFGHKSAGLPMPGLSGTANGPVGNLLKGPVDANGKLKDAALMVGIKLDLEAEVHLTARVRGDILVGLY